GDKPVIYLFTPLPLNAIVRLSLIRMVILCYISRMYHVKSSESGQSIEWNVNTHEDHTMTDVATGARVSYLFWEAVTNPCLPLSPPVISAIEPSGFEYHCPLRSIHGRSHRTATRSSFLQSKTALYLDNVLRALGLHVEARTSFIIYWLPSILRHDFIALHFLPQASYEHAAPLDVNPKPDVVTHVFMLFRRVCEDELDEWEGVSENVEFWKDIVGVDCDGMKDEALFRVMEWGGMEVKN
ncbi:hypothetical protein F5146DRAFT_938260, partial [Armillaria mellea]